MQSLYHPINRIVEEPLLHHSSARTIQERNLQQKTISETHANFLDTNEEHKIETNDFDHNAKKLSNREQSRPKFRRNRSFSQKVDQQIRNFRKRSLSIKGMRLNNSFRHQKSYTLEHLANEGVDNTGIGNETNNSTVRDNDNDNDDKSDSILDKKLLIQVDNHKISNYCQTLNVQRFQNFQNKKLQIKK